MLPLRLLTSMWRLQSVVLCTLTKWISSQRRLLNKLALIIISITAPCSEVNRTYGNSTHPYFQSECREDQRDVSGEGVQQALLKIFEGTVSAPTTFSIISVPRKRSQDSMSDSYVETENDDLITYGLIPEFIGRLPITVGLTNLCEEQLIQVANFFVSKLTMLFFFSFEKVKLHFTENALQLIAKKAAARETGARGLRSIMEDILTEAMFEIPDAREGKEKIIAVLVDEESVGPLHRRGCGAKIFRDDGALELYIHQNNITVPGLIQRYPRRNRITGLCLLVALSATKLCVYHTFSCFPSMYDWIILLLCKANVFTQ
ncbi:hypothetical protein PR202_gb01932 [Eleusine coracana subsp. coracana]|uniref:Clp ATPase C-terminal domain-containing protein n=1 Tax=Eleusine coracana subsp. coracana TaxID=191504 RepID=A0AAV5DXI5_ELECO|nr:hypothetical protein PR202_gb01932 [Eleusine coracana subsp. coracana]